MSEKPVIHNDTPEEEVHAKTVRDFPVEDIASKADLDNFENRITIKTGYMLLAMIIIVILIKAL